MRLSQASRGRGCALIMDQYLLSHHHVRVRETVKVSPVHLSLHVQLGRDIPGSLLPLQV